MSVIKVQSNGQITLPTALRKEIGINAGDLLEVRLERGRLTLIPRPLIESLRATLLQNPALAAVHTEAKRTGLDQISRREIQAEISAVRKAQRTQGRGRKTRAT